MQTDALVHVPAEKLWQCVCGAIELPNRDYEHVAVCPACERLIMEIVETLDAIEASYGRSSSAS